MSSFYIIEKLLLIKFNGFVYIKLNYDILNFTVFKHFILIKIESYLPV